MDRRSFLRLGTLSGLAAAGFGALLARAAGTDYKAAVCVFLNGGCDANNLIVPLSTSGYNDYRSARPSFALSQASLLPIVPRSGGTHGLHPAMPELQSLFNQGRVAVLANVGTLSRPTTKAQALSGSWPLPDNLLSHIDQQNQWSALSPALLSPLAGQSITGWGGRMADALRNLNAGATFPPVVSASGSNIFCDADIVASTAVDSAGAFSLPMTGDAGVDAARNAALAQLAQDNGGLVLQGAAAGGLSSVLSQAVQVQSAFSTTLRTAFPATDIGQQLYRVAQLIAARNTLGLSRQVFYVELGGFDSHADQLAAHQALLPQLSQALAAFYAATVELGVAPNVTTFTHSEFSRTLKPAGDNGSGTDHAWGGHSFILGGAVNGGDLYGAFPQLVLNGPDDVTDEGRWVPTTSVDQYAATVAAWMGVPDSGLDAVLPNLSNFAVRRLGFL
jgi:uncharacterized protein (DUF1501 family)